MHFVHRLLHAILGAIELLPYVLPFSLVRRFNDRLGVLGDRAFDANSSRQRLNPLADLLHRRRVLRLHGDKAIGNHGPKKERNARSFCKIASLVAANVFPPVHRA